MSLSVFKVREWKRTKAPLAIAISPVLGADGAPRIAVCNKGEVLVFSSKKKERLARPPWGGHPEHPISDAAWSSDGSSLAVVGQAQIYKSDSNVMCFGYDTSRDNFNENLICQPSLPSGSFFRPRSTVWSVKARPQQLLPATGFDIVSRFGVQTFDFVRPTEAELQELREQSMASAQIHTMLLLSGGANDSARAAARLADQVMMPSKARSISIPSAITDPIHKAGYRDFARVSFQDPNGVACLHSVWVTIDAIFVETTRGEDRLPAVTIPMEPNYIDQPRLSLSPDGKFFSFVRGVSCLFYEPRALEIYGLGEDGWSSKRRLDKVAAACWGPRGFEGQIAVLYEDGCLRLERTDGAETETFYRFDESLDGWKNWGRIVWAKPALDGGQPSPDFYIAVATNEKMVVFACTPDSQSQGDSSLTTPAVAEPVMRRMPASEGAPASKRARA